MYIKKNKFVYIIHSNILEICIKGKMKIYRLKNNNNNNNDDKKKKKKHSNNRKFNIKEEKQQLKI